MSGIQRIVGRAGLLPVIEEVFGQRCIWSSWEEWEGFEIAIAKVESGQFVFAITTPFGNDIRVPRQTRKTEAEAKAGAWGAVHLALEWRNLDAKNRIREATS